MLYMWGFKLKIEDTIKATREREQVMLSIGLVLSIVLSLCSNVYNCDDFEGETNFTRYVHFWAFVCVPIVAVLCFKLYRFSHIGLFKRVMGPFMRALSFYIIFFLIRVILNLILNILSLDDNRLINQPIPRIFNHLALLAYTQSLINLLTRDYSHMLSQSHVKISPDNHPAGLHIAPTE